MQIPELCPLFGTQYALLVRFQFRPGEPCKKAGFNYFWGFFGGWGWRGRIGIFKACFNSGGGGVANAQSSPGPGHTE